MASLDVYLLQDLAGDNHMRHDTTANDESGNTTCPCCATSWGKRQGWSACTAASPSVRQGDNARCCFTMFHTIWWSEI